MQPAHDLEPGPPSSPSSARAGDTGGLEPGMRISHNIRLVQLLGAGGMGSVWLADHAGLDTQVAVKFMAHELASDSSTAMRFAREAKLAARIKSPHVVQIFDYATTAEGVPFIVMELLEGEDLESRLASGRPLSLEETSRILIQICKALGRAHALGIVHRDIKPDNVFLLENDGDTFIKVLDFGIARDERRLPGVTVSGMTMGTPSYMSPEQLFFAKDVDLRSDIWATAVVIYRCITGKLPFEGDSFGSICVAINSGGFRPPSTLSDDVPPALDAWFKRALARHKDARFESAAEMANAYLATLERAGLLPQWALARHSKGELPSYATDPGG
ncbi:MAG TPA: serine/threonine-protein kinase, partial [Polyangiaceae bacterium]|nr:serine/threonine-protein kinase [Polyangiaceae bacterium]